jgi:hypothetical protein
MRSNVQNTALQDNLGDIDNKLSTIEETLKDMVKISIEQIKNNPEKENDLISLWANHANNISDFFFEECEKSDNKGLYKNIVKYMIFNK